VTPNRETVTDAISLVRVRLVSPWWSYGEGKGEQGTIYAGPVTLEWEQVVIDTKSPPELGRWWQRALGWVVVHDGSDEFEIRPTPDRTPGLLFVANNEEKTKKNRLHLDFRPDDQDAEVTRLLGLGARQVDIGQGDRGWVVLCDPEGNEFCVLRSGSSAE